MASSQLDLIIAFPSILRLKPIHFPVIVAVHVVAKLTHSRLELAKKSLQPLRFGSFLLHSVPSRGGCRIHTLFFSIRPISEPIRT